MQIGDRGLQADSVTTSLVKCSRPSKSLLNTSPNDCKSIATPLGLLLPSVAQTTIETQNDYLSLPNQILGFTGTDIELCHQSPS